MKKSICLLGFTGLFAFSFGQLPNYEVTGKIDGAEGVTFILQKTVAGKIIQLGSAKVTNGAFKITGGSVVYPEMVSLVTLDKKRGLSFFLENSSVTITGRLDSLNDARITGSKTQDEYSVLNASMKPLIEKLTRLTIEYRTANEAIMKEMRSIQKEFVLNNPNSFATPNILRSMVNEMKPNEIEEIITAMNPEVANTQTVADIKANIMSKKSVDIGQKAPDFTLNDVNGHPVKLSSKVGSKLLLIDFWAAWCGPCRRENPNVVKVFNEFKSKGFDIFGVSLDRTRAEWIKAIATDDLRWTHVSDLQYFNCTAAKLYAVNAIPANFLLDQNGIIIAKNIRGEDLYNKVKELLTNK